MGHSICLQDWTTIKGGTTTTKVTQNEDLYADIERYRDLVLFLEVSDFAGTPTLQLQTSPTKDDRLFQLIDTSASFAIATAGAFTPAILRYSQVTVPPARYLRWAFTGSSTAPWSCTFRLVVSATLS